MKIPRPRPPRQALPKPTPIEWMLLAIPPVIVSVVIWYSIEPMGRLELAASIALGVFVSTLGWGLYQVRKDKQNRVSKDRA